jgi:phosphoribosylamine--glycine ligase
LAAGKGVLILDNLEEAYSQLKEILEGKFGSAGSRVVIEEFLAGIELSLFVLTDGKDYIVLPEAKDYKRVGESDTGLNTGGMGSVSPVPFADAEFLKRVEERVVKPTIYGIESENMDYSGFVFIGLMNCGGNPYVIEYNVRMGDPETQSVMPRIKSDFLEHLILASKKQLRGDSVEVYNHTQLTLVTVSGGYPQEFKKGYIINGLEELDLSDYFVAGAKIDNGAIVTNGGRVLNITASGHNILEAREKLYELVSKVTYQDKYFRKDIGLDLIK